jgi:3-phosphoshikimate 1-carboxyvinyltransferase
MTPRSINCRVQPGGRLHGSIRVPGDKSISHRSVMLGALAEGVTGISGLLEGEDVLATIGAFRAMGVSLKWSAAESPAVERRLLIHGAGLHGLSRPPAILDVGNSGTAMRLMAGILAGQNFDSELSGDQSLRKRPMARVAAPLNAMGARVETAAGGLPPLKIRGGQALVGIDYALPVPSAQVKSAILLAGLYAKGTTTVTEPLPTRDHTERMLRGFGYPVESEGSRIRLVGGKVLRACSISVPADVSSAAFFMVAAAMTPNSEIVLEHVGINPTRIGVINILKQMNASLTLTNAREIGGEPVADIRIAGSHLHGIVIPSDQVPLAIDEFPALFIAAAAAIGKTILTGAKELRVKESDRIAVMAQGLRTLGITLQELPDGIAIEGGSLRGGVVDSQGDHRVAMAFAMAGLRADGPITIRDCKNVDTSFPGFVPLAARAGLSITEFTE